MSAPWLVKWQMTTNRAAHHLLIISGFLGLKLRHWFPTQNLRTWPCPFLEAQGRNLFPGSFRLLIEFRTIQLLADGCSQLLEGHLHEKGLRPPSSQQQRVEKSFWHFSFLLLPFCLIAPAFLIWHPSSDFSRRNFPAFQGSHVETGLTWTFQDHFSVLRFITLMTTGKFLYRSTLIRVEKPEHGDFRRHLFINLPTTVV